MIGQTTATAQPLVLVVEDEVPLLGLLCLVIGRLGYRTQGAASGAEALRYLDDGFPVDVLMTDVRLGQGESGVVLAQHVRQRIPALPVVFMSGYNVLPDAGARDISEVFLRKPCAPDLMAKALSQVLHDCGTLTGAHAPLA